MSSEDHDTVRVVVGLAIIIGATIGGGFWATPVVAGALAGPLSIVLTLLVAVVLVLATPVYVLLSRVWPVSPGHFYYPTRLLVPENRVLSHLIGWVVNWAAIFVGGFTVTRYMTTAGAQFLNGLVPTVPTSVFTMVLITFSFVLIWFGLRIAGRIELVLSVSLLLAMSLIVLYGLFVVNVDNLTPIAPSGFTNALPAYALLFSLGAGPLLAIDIAGEIEDPESSVRTIIWSGGAANIGFGALIGVVVLGLVPLSQLQDATLTTIVQEQYPSILVLVSGVGALFAGVTTNVGYVLIVNRYANAAADDGILPRWVARHNRYGEPWVLLVLMYLSSILAIVVDLPLSAIASGFAFVLLAQASLLLLVGFRVPRQYPFLFRTDAVRNSWYLRPKVVRWASLVGAVLTLVVLGFLSYDQPATFGWLVATSIVGVGIYAIQFWRKGGTDLAPHPPDAFDEAE